MKYDISNSNLNTKFSLKVYRCQLFKTEDDSCCCSCNSDAMFEVMKSLYDCYKKKDCDNCNCILCGHLPREERKLGELRKSGVQIAVEDKKKLLKSKSLSYLGKSLAEKEKALKDIALAGRPLPKGKTKSDKDLIMKVRRDLGLPPETTNASDSEKYKKAYKAGIIIPLNGKTLPEKEEILTKLAENGIPLPEGRTTSEKALIEKIRANQGIPFPEAKTPSDQKLMNEVREEAGQKLTGLITPLDGKSKEQKKAILIELAKKGLPLPQAKSASDQEIMDKVRMDIGLPSEPKTAIEKDNYNRAMAAGIIIPLNGKTPSEKEKILREQAKMGLQLPEGRTPSEKALISKIKTTTPLKALPKEQKEKILKDLAKQATTPLKGLTKEQKENILKDLAKQGLPLPEAKSASEQKFMDKVRAQLGLPPEPKDETSKKIYNKALADGIIIPLNGKTPSEKEKILKEQAKMGLQLPEGRTPSEKALISKIKTTTPLKGLPKEQKEKILKDLAKQGLPLPEAQSASEQKLMDQVRAELGLPPEPKDETSKTKYDKALADGIIIPLNGKTPEQKERILKDLVKEGLPLPEAKSASEKKLMDKIRAELGLPPEPKDESSKKVYEKALADGIIIPLNGKTPSQKEKILRQQAKMGLQLPEGRTPSEKALITKIKATTPLKGIPKEQKERMLKDLAKEGLQLPEAKSASEKELIDKVRAELGLPPEPKDKSSKKIYDKALAAGIIIPLNGKTPSEKEEILREQAKMGLQLPEGRTPSEKALISKIKTTTPLKGLTKEQKENILKDIAKQGIPLPEAQSASEQKLMDQVRAELGLPPEPRDETSKTKYDKALADGIIIPLNGKTPAEKEKILREQAKMGLQLPKGRTPSEKALISKIKATTPLKGLPKEQKERILKDLAKEGLPLPEAKSASEQELMDKVRAELGLPPEPKDKSSKKLYDKALAAGIIIPLKGKTPSQKEEILREQAKMGLQLPKGRTPSEKALVSKIKATTPLKGEQAQMGLQLPKGRTPSEKALISKIKATTPLKGLPKEQKENILKDLAKQGIPLPEAQSASEKKLMDQVRAKLGLPPEPKDETSKTIYDKALADGIIIPLNGKTPSQKEKILREQAKMGLQLPEGRTPSEKALISKIKATTPLKGLPKEQKERILKDLANEGLPLPEAKSASEQELMDKVRAELGLPPEPKDKSSKKIYDKALADGIIIPLNGKTPSQKEKILREQAKMGLQLPEGRTPSEKALISKIKTTTPLKGLPKEQKEGILKDLAKEGLPLPEAKSTSEKELMDKIRTELGLPPEPKDKSSKKKYDKALAAGIIIPLNGKTSSEKEEILREQAKMGLQLPEGRTPSEKALISKIKATTPLKGLPKEQKESILKDLAKQATTPLKGLPKEQKERMLKDLAKQGLPLPEAKSASEQKLMDHVRAELGLPPEPKDKSSKTIYDKALADGIIIPLNGKTPSQKEKILRKQAKMGLQLPEGRTPSEKALILKIKAETPLKEPKDKSLKEKYDRAMSAGLITPLEGKSDSRKEEILRGLVQKGVPLPRATTTSEQDVIDKVRAEVGLPPEPKDKQSKEKYDRAMAAGLITPLEGKSDSRKEEILRGQAKLGLPLPKGRTPSEKALIKKIKATTSVSDILSTKPTHVAGRPTLPPEQFKKMDLETRKSLKESKSPSDECICELFPQKVSQDVSPSEKLRKAKAAGLLTPLDGKSKEEKLKILKSLAKQGLPLPEANTDSDQELIDRFRADIGLPPEPTTSAEKKKYKKAMADGLITPLEGKSDSRKEEILRGQAKLGLQLPEGRTPSEKALISKIKAASPLKGLPKESKIKETSPLSGKTKAQREKILKGLLRDGLPLPRATTSSEQEVINKVRADVGLPPEPKDKLSEENYDRAMAAGLITPLEGKSDSRKEEILRGQAKLGLPLPKGRTPSEKALISKIKAEAPLKGLPKEQKEKILKGLVKKGVPLPMATTSSEQDLMDKVRADFGLPPEPKDKSFKEKYDRAMAAGLITPLEGKSDSRKEEILRGQAKLGLQLPEGRTPSEKALISKIKAETPLKGLPKEQKEKILKGLVKKGVPLPTATTSSEQDLIDKIRADVGLPPEPKDKSTKEKYDRAMAAGLITPLEGKSDSRKEEILRGRAQLGLQLPEGRTPSEKALIKKIKATTLLGPPALPPEKIEKLVAKYIRKAKSGELLASLHGKNPEEKKKILKDLALKGIPLPKAKTASEQRMLDEIHFEVGLPPSPKTKRDKEIYKKAMAAGLITPLIGKSPAKKEEILRAQAKLGLPLPVGRTNSEKALVSKIKKTTQTEAKPSSSIKTISMKSGDTSMKKHVKGVGVSKSKGEIIEEFEDIVKTTKCDRGCGCDKKKIRFKHSYVKIRVTSPDISSLCPCPEECVPGVKGGVFTDNDGIKVVIGRVIGVPWLYSSELNQKRKLKTKRKLNDFTKTIDTKLSPHLNIYTSSLMGTDKNVLKEYQNPRRTKAYPEKPGQKVSFDVGCKEEERLSGLPPTPIVNKSPPKGPKEDASCPCSYILKSGSPTEEKWLNNGNTNTITKEDKTIIKNENIQCKCSMKPKPDFQVTPINESQMRILKSELTQCVSGFKLNVPRKAVEPEVSFEKILKYYVEKSEQIQYEDSKNDKNDKKRKPVSKKKNSMECECPKTEPVKGFKFHIGAKGPRSNGLAGILCFPLDISRSTF
ncbi:uncharacterized protein LOC112045878 [Bicyclus anynana]|uniref:Uncharacterized protein LOC112045878 n=1 Tax=Bicyclus anynana TaxID=110368 RepID=A0ABM3M5J5_BICAN|nr:uncharacterized protein LOC112045878 [Bicyclus anynana]